MINLNKIIIGVLLFTSICMGGYIYFNAGKSSPVSTPFSKKVEIVTEAKLLARKTDKKGLSHTIVEETNNVLPANLIDEGYSNAFVDSLIAETDIQKKEITALTKINQTIKADNLQAVQLINSLQEKVYEYHDTNVSLSFKTDSLANGLFDYEFNQSLDIREYSRKKWFLGKEHQMMDISSTSKFSTINKVNKLTIEKKEDPFDITATSKALFLPKTGNYGVGGQLKVRYKNLSATGSNIYFPVTKKFVPVLGLEYRVFKF